MNAHGLIVFAPGQERIDRFMSNALNDNYSIIPDSSQARVLLLREENGWSLPRHQATMAAEINEAMLAQLGISTTVLDCVYDRYKDPEREDEHLVYALENHSPEVLPPDNGRWVARTELADLPLVVPEHRAVLEAWFSNTGQDMQDKQGERGEQGAAWMQPGWFNGARGWIEEQLERLGYILAAPIEQFTALSWGTVLRVPTTSGMLYFKAPAPAVAFEPVLAQTLARLVPGSVPEVCALDERRHWLFMRNGGTPLRSDSPDCARSAEALRQYAQMQIALAPHIETLKATGCPDQRLAVLPDLYQEVLAAPSFLLLDQPKGLPRSEYEQLLAFTPRLREMCAELADCGVPESLEHDDLHSRNILYNGQRYVFIDVGECCLAHPFGSMFVVLRDAKYILEYDEQERERLCQAYLDPWTRYASMERLKRAFELAHRLGALYRALSWYRLLAPIEPERRGKLEDSVLYFLQVFLGTQE